MTAMNAAIKKANVGTDKQQLYLRAVDFVRKNKKQGGEFTEDEARRFVRAIWNERHLVEEMLGREYICRCALETLERARSDMDGDVLSGGGPRVASDVQVDAAAAGQQDGDDVGQKKLDVQPAGSRTSPADRDGRGHQKRDDHTSVAPPVRVISASQLQTMAQARTKLARSLLDRKLTSDGRAWGDVGCHELDGMARDGALARAIRNHIGVLPEKDRFKSVRALVTPAQFEVICRNVERANDKD